MGQTLLSALRISHLRISLEYHYKYFFLFHIVSFRTVIVIGSKLFDVCHLTKLFEGLLCAVDSNQRRDVIYRFLIQATRLFFLPMVL